MNHDELNHWSKRAADWARDYHATLRDKPVRPDIQPGEFRAKIDFKRTILWEGTVAEFYAGGATEEQTGYWSADFFKALTTHYGLTREQAVYFSTHEEADLKEHEGGVMGHGSFRRLVLQRLLEDGIEVRAGYDLDYCGLTAVDLHGDILNASLAAAG